MPQRHSRNNNDLAIFTYEERRKLGFGTQRERLGKDSIKPFDSCCVCLKPPIEPLCCKGGHLFCKECIYSYLLEQKKGIKRKLAMFNSQEKQDQEEAADKLLGARERQLAAFERQNNSAVPSGEDRGGSASGGGSFHGANSVKTTAFEAEALRTMKAYWLPSSTPEAVERAEAPSKDTTCPQGGEKLKVKDLFPVHFTPVPMTGGAVAEIDKVPLMCPSCSVTFTNASKLTALSTCGHIVCRKCGEDFVAKDGACMVCQEACGPEQLVKIEQGGTGFAGHGNDLTAVAFKHLGSGSGAAPLRPVTKF